MATRRVFYVKDGRVNSEEIDFRYNPFQKKSSISNMHKNLSGKALEVSTKSKEELGVKLSSCNLKLHGFPLDNVYEASKIFQFGGPYVDLLEVSTQKAKRDYRLKNSGQLIAYEYNGERWCACLNVLFYEYIYIYAVKDTVSFNDIMKLLEYEYFTDIAYKKSANLARAVAVIKSMLLIFKSIPEMTYNDFFWYHRNFVVP